jgi:hypothetical protein
MVDRAFGWLVLVLGAVPVPALTDEAATLLDDVATALGETLPETLRIHGAGSGYVIAGREPSSERFRVESYVLELELGSGVAAERVVAAASGPGPAEFAEPVSSTATPDSPASERYRFWMTPYGFVAGAGEHAFALDTETLAGSRYRVLSFVPGGGERVRAFINEDDLIERTRAAVDRPGGDRVELESVYLDWQDFDGLSYPAIVIEKWNGELYRVLVVRSVESDLAPAPTAPSEGA